MIVRLIMAALAALPLAAVAHHSRTEYASEVLELDGELVRIHWANPHPTFALRTAAGETWNLELYGSISSLARTGVDGALFRIGQSIRVAAYPSLRRERQGLATHALLPDGTEAVLQYDVGPRWSERYVGGQRADVFDATVLAKAAAENKGVFRVWSIPSFSIATTATRALAPRFTDAAVAARKRWDIVDNPVTRCEPPWMPRVMLPPARRELIDGGDIITLRLAYFDGTRTIHMRNAPSAATEPPSRMGYSVGRWDENALVVETSRITAPAFDAIGSLQSDAMTVTERFTLSDDESRLDYEAVMSDPAAFAEPVVFRTYFLALGEPFEPILCDASNLQAAQGAAP